MRIANVIGTVTLCRCHPSLTGFRWVLAAPYSLAALREGGADGEEVVALDELGVGLGSTIALSEGAEAQMPFYPNKKPIEAYVAAVLDTVSLNGPIAASLTKG